jgi:type IV pilus assembly protein PilX
MKALPMNSAKFPSQARGMVLVTSLLLLVVVTILAVGMFRSFGIDEKIAGNVREKQKALNAAETAEQNAESWLSLGLNTGAVTCAAPMVAANVGQVCTNTLVSLGLNPAVVPWQIVPGGTANNIGVLYTPSDGTNIMTTGTGGYSALPGYYIGLLGSVTANRITTTYYQIDAVGYGSSPDTAAVVEATYTTTSSTACLSCQ